jgi:hypothetical protein
VRNVNERRTMRTSRSVAVTRLLTRTIAVMEVSAKLTVRLEISGNEGDRYQGGGRG